MSTRNLRQQKYRDRQRTLGRKTITIQLPVELIETLHSGKEADTLSAYVEKVLLAGLKTVTNNAEPVKIEKETPLAAHDWDAAEKKFADDIEMSKYRHVQSLAESGYTFGAIAEKLTFEGYPPPKGKTRWHANTVRAILKNQK